jgi:sigma-B regulation protein RsbU (phosphoserine phosphatase)
MLYGIALLMAGTMIAFITRSTSRLSRGAAEVARGNLDYRIKVTRRDQLGDLAAAFNGMTDSVQDMLDQVADRERLARELELAREIQESLLPDRHLRHGPFTVHATFRPATEVGGDYFDIFPLTEGRLVVVIGDVAGHGLHTGLLMASLKSSVAALIHEGYTGPDLVERVNRLMLDQRSSHTIATLTVVEIDPNAEHVHITNAGHPPAFLLTMEGSEELLAGSIPIGSALCRPSELERSFPTSGVLVLYSDGLPEALGPAGDPYGYERLAEVLGECRSFGGGELTAAILGDLDRHAAGTPLADDFTLVIVESGGVNASDGRAPDSTEST